jgi:hypothetical protein
VAVEVAAGGDPAASARARLRSLGTAYLRFAVAEPGLFRVAFGPRGPWPTAADDGPGIEAEDGPFPLLSQVLDDLAAAGGLVVERRPGLEYVVWAGVHGVAVLYLDGPLARLGSAERDQMFTRVIDATIRGLLYSRVRGSSLGLPDVSRSTGRLASADGGTSAAPRRSMRFPDSHRQGSRGVRVLCTVPRDALFGAACCGQDRPGSCRPGGVRLGLCVGRLGAGGGGVLAGRIRGPPARAVRAASTSSRS